MKIGDKGESFVLVTPDGEGFAYCVDAEGEEIRRGNYNDALNAVDEAIENYGGQEVYIMKEYREVVESVAVPMIDSEGNVV